jgi:hypothetical protein
MPSVLATLRVAVLEADIGIDRNVWMTSAPRAGEDTGSRL